MTTTHDSTGQPSTGASPSGDHVTLDARSLRGLAHPIRLRILGLLREGGPSTATALATEIGHSSGVTSYHLRQLAAYGFVVEDSEGRTGRRERWWRAAHRSTVLEPLPDPDVETTLLVDEYLRIIAGAYAERLLRYVDGIDGIRAALGTGWSDVSDLSDWAFVLTPDQTRALDEQVHALMADLPVHDPLQPLPEGTARVVVQLQVMPTPTRALAEETR